MRFRPPIERHRAYLAQAVEIFMTAQVEIVRPITPSYDPITGRATAASQNDHIGYTGRAQITRSGSAGQVLSGESFSEISTVQVLLPLDGTPVPRVEDLVLVIDCPEDPKLTGEVLRINDVTYGGLTSPTRTLSCTFATATPFNPNS